MIHILKNPIGIVGGISTFESSQCRKTLGPVIELDALLASLQSYMAKGSSFKLQALPLCYLLNRRAGSYRSEGIVQENPATVPDSY